MPPAPQMPVKTRKNFNIRYTLSGGLMSRRGDKHRGVDKFPAAGGTEMMRSVCRRFRQWL
jgi:hypothetical protein